MKFKTHHRNHSFPPSFHVKQKGQKEADPHDSSIPDIESEPWLYFLEEEGSEHLHFDAGILAGTKSAKRKANKFRPPQDQLEEPLQNFNDYHNYTAQQHGYVRNQRPHLGNIVRREGSSTNRQPRRSSRPSFSSRPHSWQEPSPNLFPLQEEIPEIIVTDCGNDRACVDYDDNPGVQQDGVVAVEVSGSSIDKISMAEPPGISASEPEEQPDSKLNQMWLAERARL